MRQNKGVLAKPLIMLGKNKIMVFLLMGATVFCYLPVVIQPSPSSIIWRLVWLLRCLVRKFRINSRLSKIARSLGKLQRMEWGIRHLWPSDVTAEVRPLRSRSLLPATRIRIREIIPQILTNIVMLQFGSYCLHFLLPQGVLASV